MYYHTVSCEDCEECQRERQLACCKDPCAQKCDKSESCVKCLDCNQDNCDCSKSCDDCEKSCKSCKKKNCDCSKSINSELSSLSEKLKPEPKRKTYIVTKGCKKGHPWSSYNRGSESIYVNGVNGPTLYLNYGCRYCFRFNEPGFILTTSPIGGSNAKIVKGNFEVISDNSFEFEANELTPRVFFYQDNEFTFEGGVVFLREV
jgi:hypothetical protein